MHCMSDEYLVEELCIEYQEKKSERIKEIQKEKEVKI